MRTVSLMPLHSLVELDLSPSFHWKRLAVTHPVTKPNVLSQPVTFKTDLWLTLLENAGGTEEQSWWLTDVKQVEKKLELIYVNVVPFDVTDRRNINRDIDSYRLLTGRKRVWRGKILFRKSTRGQSLHGSFHCSTNSMLQRLLGDVYGYRYV
jgi:hypothetical protein